MNVLQQIFTDYYEEIEYILHPRKTEMENIDKMIHCGDPSFGGAMYGCPHCGKLKFVPFRCHSRFCPTCGNKTRTKVNPDTVLKRFPLFCPKCGKEHIVDVQGQNIILSEPDAKTQSR